jgi:hypothetical protein
MRKGPGSAFEKWSISLDICDTGSLQRLTKSWWGQKNFRSDDLNLTTRKPSSGFYAAQSIVFRIVICRIVPFLLTIVLSVLRFTDSDYPVGIFIIIIRYCIQSIYIFCISSTKLSTTRFHPEDHWLFKRFYCQ